MVFPRFPCHFIQQPLSSFGHNKTGTDAEMRGKSGRKKENLIRVWEMCTTCATGSGCVTISPGFLSANRPTRTRTTDQALETPKWTLRFFADSTNELGWFSQSLKWISIFPSPLVRRSSFSLSVTLCLAACVTLCGTCLPICWWFSKFKSPSEITSLL